MTTTPKTMTTAFPTDKTQPFVAENGVTYVYDSNRWRVKQYKLDDSALEDYATKEWTEDKIAEAELDGDIDLTNYATIVYSDAEDETLQNQIDELGVTKGKVARYTTDNVSGSPVSRPGQLAFDASDPASVNLASFGIEDADGVLTKPMANQDIIEFVDAVNNKVSRYKITDASGAPTLVAVEYVSGDNDFQVGEEEQVYIYPQNASGASKDYVDAQDAFRLPLTGGELTGSLTVNRGDKPHPQWKIAPNGGSDYATNIYSLGGPVRFRSSHTGNEGDHHGSHIVLDPDVAGGGANQTTKIYKVPTPNQPDMAASKQYVDDALASGGSLPTASTGIKGGVKVGTTGGSYVSCTKMSGETIGVVEATNSVRGVQYKGQACVTSKSTPEAGEYQQGALIFSTSTNSLYIRT